MGRGTLVRRILLVGGLCLVAAAIARVPEIAAGGLLYPARRTTIAAMPEGCVERVVDSSGLALHGWSCATGAARRGTIVYLHGIADNRSSSVEVIRRYLSRGYDVVAYDSRRHGTSA